MNSKKEALTGIANKRLNNQDVRNNQITFPLADTNEVMEESKLTIPPKEDVIHAKEWIDNGSRL